MNKRQMQMLEGIKELAESGKNSESFTSIGNAYLDMIIAFVEDIENDDGEKLKILRDRAVESYVGWVTNYDIFTPMYKMRKELERQGIDVQREIEMYKEKLSKERRD
jgi:hypothetical protein